MTKEEIFKCFLNTGIFYEMNAEERSLLLEICLRMKNDGLADIKYIKKLTNFDDKSLETLISNGFVEKYNDYFVSIPEEVFIDG